MDEALLRTGLGDARYDPPPPFEACLGDTRPPPPVGKGASGGTGAAERGRVDRPGERGGVRCGDIGRGFVLLVCPSLLPLGFRCELYFCRWSLAASRAS
eukprot:scaffold56603_cov35-Prasinocladus_malaysianus.AAC.1